MKSWLMGFPITHSLVDVRVPLHVMSTPFKLLLCFSAASTAKIPLH